MLETKYANAYTEVCEILNYLNKDEYNKIPQEIIDVFEDNKNIDYLYEIDLDKDLTEQQISKEAKAILLNIFRDYLATSDQNTKIKEWLAKDRMFLERQKQQKYSKDVFEKYSNSNTNNSMADNSLLEDIKSQSFFKRIIDKIKKFFNNL